MRSGAYSSTTFLSALPKSPTRLQQMQPEFISVTPGVLHEAAVNAYLAEFVLYEHQPFALVGLGYELLYKGGLASAQKAGKNINLGHLLLHLFP